ncbi:unnamed protein product [Diamesa serratosioi]
MVKLNVTYTLGEVSLRNGLSMPSIWIVIRDSVYDVTHFVNKHPGGIALIMDHAEKDATEDFESFDNLHSSNALKKLKKLKIVYNVTEYLEHHPGGKALIMEFAGKDATKDFDDIGHSSDAYKMLKKFKIGELIEEDRKCNRNIVSPSISPEPSVKSLDIKKKRKRRVLLFCG